MECIESLSTRLCAADGFLVKDDKFGAGGAGPRCQLSFTSLLTRYNFSVCRKLEDASAVRFFPPRNSEEGVSRGIRGTRLQSKADTNSFLHVLLCCTHVLLCLSSSSLQK